MMRERYPTSRLRFGYIGTTQTKVCVENQKLCASPSHSSEDSCSGTLHSGLVSIPLATFAKKCLVRFRLAQHTISGSLVCHSLSQIYQNVTLFFNGILVNFGYLHVMCNKFFYYLFFLNFLF